MELIAAVDRTWGLGRGGKLLFSIPEDLAWFRSLTWGNIIVYGRKTLATFPGEKPLPGRENWILSRNAAFSAPGAVTFSSIPALLRASQRRTVFVVGGAEVYESLLPWCSRAHLTMVAADGGADCFLRNLDREEAWRRVRVGPKLRYQELTYRHCVYQRSKPEQAMMR